MASKQESRREKVLRGVEEIGKATKDDIAQAGRPLNEFEKQLKLVEQEEKWINIELNVPKGEVRTYEQEKKAVRLRAHLRAERKRINRRNNIKRAITTGIIGFLALLGVNSLKDKLLPEPIEPEPAPVGGSQETENSEEKKMAETLQNATLEQKQQLVTSYLMEKASEAGLESSSELENSEIIKMHQDNKTQKDIYDGYIVTLEDGQELFVLDENGAEDTLKEMGVNYEIIRAESTEGYRKSIDGNIIKSENGQVVYGKATVELERENDEYTRFKEYPIVDANGVTTFDEESYYQMDKMINEDIDLIEYATGEKMTTEEIGDVLLSNSDFREIYNKVFNDGKEAKANVMEFVSIDSNGNEITAEIEKVKEELEARNPFVAGLRVDTDGITASNNGQTHSPELNQQNIQHETGDDGRC